MGGNVQETTSEPDGSSGTNLNRHLGNIMKREWMVTRNQRGSFLKNKPINIIWFPQMETWLTEQIKVTKDRPLIFFFFFLELNTDRLPPA